MDYINIMVIDDYLLVAEGIKEMLKENLRPCLVKHFDSAEKARNELYCHRYHQVFIGVKPHGRIGVAFIRALRLLFPELVIIVLCTESNINLASNLFALGINGIVSKHEGMEELKIAIYKIMQGKQYVSPLMAIPYEATAATTDKIRISKRESEVMQCVANGKSIVETANILQLSRHTIVTHRRRIMEKLGVKSATEMASYVYKNHLLNAC